MRCGVTDVAQLEKLLKLFFGYERAEIAVRDFVSPSFGEVLSIYRQKSETAKEFKRLQAVGGIDRHALTGGQFARDAHLSVGRDLDPAPP